MVVFCAICLLDFCFSKFKLTKFEPSSKNIKKRVKNCVSSLFMVQQQKYWRNIAICHNESLSQAINMRNYITASIKVWPEFSSLKPSIWLRKC